MFMYGMFMTHTDTLSVVCESGTPKMIKAEYRSDCSALMSELSAVTFFSIADLTKNGQSLSNASIEEVMSSLLNRQLNPNQDVSQNLGVCVFSI